MPTEQLAAFRAGALTTRWSHVRAFSCSALLLLVMTADQTAALLDEDLVIARQGYFLTMGPSEMTQEDS